MQITEQDDTIDLILAVLITYPIQIVQVVFVCFIIGIKMKAKQHDYDDDRK